MTYSFDNAVRTQPIRELHEVKTACSGNQPYALPVHCSWQADSCPTHSCLMLGQRWHLQVPPEQLLDWKRPAGQCEAEWFLQASSSP